MGRFRKFSGREGGGFLFAGPLVLFLALLPAKSAPAFVTARSLVLDLSPSSGSIRATFTVEIENDRPVPLGRQQFFLYPEMFNAGFLKDNFEDVVDGRSIRPGSFTMTAAEAGDGREVGFEREQGPYMSLVFGLPLAPGERNTVTLRYELLIPNHFSCFSAVRKGLYLNGAFYPLPVSRRNGRPELSLQNGEVSFAVRVKEGGKKVLLIPHRSGYVTGDGSVGVVAALPGMKEVGLFLADFREVSLGTGGVNATLFREKMSGRQEQKIEETIDQVSLFLKQRHPDLLDDLEGLLVVEAPLRKRVSFFTTYGVVVSDRIFDSLYLFQSQHQESLIEAVFSYLASSRDGGKGFISRVYAEFVGEILKDEFREFTELRLRSLRNMVKPFRFIPQFDSIYYDREMPFSRSYIRTVYRFGFPGEDFPTAEYRRVTGDSIYRVMRSYETIDARYVLTRYLAGADLLEVLSEAGLKDDFLSLLVADPRSDYRLVSVEARDGSHEIKLANPREDAPREGVKVLVSLSDGTEKNLVWDTEQREASLTVESAPGVEVKNVAVDPDLVMEDTDRSNNYVKRPLRFVLQSTRFSYDFNTKDFQGSVLFYFKRAYDPINAYFLRLSTSDDSSSTEFIYRRAIKLRRQGGLFWVGGIRYTHERTLIPSEENFVEGFFSLDYSTPTFPFFPVRDIRGVVSFIPGFFGRGGKNQFYTLLTRVVKYFQIDLKDTLALKLDSGVVWGDVPDVRLLDLGGKSRIRGIKSDDAEVENFVIGTVELRHLVTNDLDAGLPWGLFSVHGFAVNLFLDGGIGKFPARAREKRKGFRASSGVGFFFIGNFLGIAEVKVNFELARELDRFKDNSTLFYFKFDQSF
ncbi:MAG: hypothetical protein GTN70_00800 [Deltaproteobacteria bacterium]|nr:hypothetical protein [Deltaproteobacteria bacterium]NIS76193.1 hypothetical protein [Deltaproteobacteria bacterium]